MEEETNTWLAEESRWKNMNWWTIMKISAWNMKEVMCYKYRLQLGKRCMMRDGKIAKV